MRGVMACSDSLSLSTWTPRVLTLIFNSSLTRHHSYAFVFILSNTKGQVSQWLRRCLFQDALKGPLFEPHQDLVLFSFCKPHIFQLFSYFSYLFNIFMLF